MKALPLLALTISTRALSVCIVLVIEGSAQTFAQVADLDPANQLGPRLTSTVTRNKLQGRKLFGTLNAHITLVDAVITVPIVPIPVAYEFASDMAWNRVLFGQKDDYIREFNNSGSSTTRILGPGGLDISATRTLFIADRLNGRILLTRFNSQAKSLSQIAVTPTDADLKSVTDVAWDGGSTPLVSEYFYALALSANMSETPTPW